MRLMRFVFVLILFFSGVVAFSQTSNYKFRRLNISDGLSNSQVRSVLVDNNGFAWFGTISGLNRYDGYSIKTFKNDPNDSLSLPISSIYRISEDYDGKLWVFANDNEVTVYDPIKEAFSDSHEVFEQVNKVDRHNISEILLDNDSNLWISNSYSGIYHFNRLTKEVKHILHNENDSNSPVSNNVFDLAKDKNGDIWAINSKGILERIDSDNFKVVERIPIHHELKTDGNQSLQIFIDASEDIWVYSQSNATGLFYYSKASKEILRFHSKSINHRLNSDIITGVEQDANGIIWVGTDHGGVNLIDKSNFNVEVLIHEVGVDNSLSQNSVTTIYKDINGIIWVGTYKNGLNFYHPNLFQFGLEKHYPFRNSGLPANDIDCFAEDERGNLWIGTNGSGLIYYNKSTGNYKVFKHNPNNKNSISNDVIVSLYIDHLNRLWIGTYYGGLNMYDGRIFKRFLNDPNDPETISDNRIWQIYEDSRNRIWVGTLGGGLDLYEPKTNRFLHFKSGALNSITSDFILSMSEDSEGLLWVGTSHGIDMLDPRTGRFTHFEKEEGNPNSLCNNVVLSIREDKRGWIWFGTRNGLSCLNKESQRFQSFNIKDGLPDNNIISILEDENANLWMSTLNGISNMRIFESDDPETINYSFRNYDIIDGLQGKEFNEHSGYKTSQGELLFGGANGYNRFKPQDIIDANVETKVVFTAFRLHNKIVEINEEINGRIILDASISTISEIVLNHNQNVFSIEFSALNFLNPEKTQYRYKLEGFNDDWITTDASNRQATFTNLNPGSYTFKVAASSGEGGFNDNVKMVRIVVVPPIYATPTAFVIYFILIILIILLLIRIIIRREHLKFARKQELMQHQRLHELDNMKIRFFTNISHEFRTPLTLILTPLEKLIKNSTDESSRGQLIIIQRNGKRLLNLVNKLLDFRKMEVKNISINLSFGNIIRFLRETVNSFSDLSESKHISLNFNSSVAELFTYFDHDKIEKVVFNLLSNSFKFTPPDGLITVSIDCFNDDKSSKNSLFDGNSYIELRVSDTGIGISKDKQEVIFERFFQSKNTGTMMNQGSGIGLSLVQEFIRLHEGTIHVESEIEQGSTFIVRLPLVTEDDKIIANSASYPLETNKDENNSSISVENDTVETGDFNKNKSKETVLIVEDNEDLRFYLKDNLQSLYIIEEAENGKDGWEKVKKIKPTLVVSDIMMPIMDGMELCRKVKKDEQTSHIPIILLSAKSTNEQKLEGLEAGADDYVTKPFNYEILEIKIKKLIDQRKDFQNSLSLQYEIKPGEIGVTSLDEKFIKKALDIVETNISNSDFSVEKLSKEMSVSRGHLYNKLSALTGKTPIEFIRIMRLKRAGQLLGKSQLTVSEVAFEVGFNDPKYFSKYFKEEFGISPSEYAKKVIADE